MENTKNILLPRVMVFLNEKNVKQLPPKLLILKNRTKLKIISSETDKNWNVYPQ